jgi:hypothetical protein
LRTSKFIATIGIILSVPLFSWASDFLIDEKLPQRINMGVRNPTQQKIIVAVADCGFDTTHPYLSPYLKEGYNGITKSPDIKARVNTSITDFEYGQTDKHATHVASTIIQIATDGVEIVPCRVGAHFKNVLAYLTTRDDIKIINISMAICLEDSTERDLLLTLARQGKIMVKSAGNAGIAIDQSKDKDLIELARHSDVHGRFIFVGKTETIESSEVLVYPSNFAGSARDYFICAPGDVDSAVPLDNSSDGHAKNRGTSMAAPVVSGAIARLMAEYPQASADEIVSCVFQSATKDYGGEILDPHFYGQGILNLEAARRMLRHRFEPLSSIPLLTINVAPLSIFTRQRDLREDLNQFETSLPDSNHSQDIDYFRKVADTYKHLNRLKITFFEEKQRTIEKEIKLRDMILQSSEQKQIKDLRKAASAYKRLFLLNKDPRTGKDEINLRLVILQHPDYQNTALDLRKAFWAYRDIFDVLSLRLEKIQVKEEEVKLRKLLLTMPSYKPWLIDLQCIASAYRDLYSLYDTDDKKFHILGEEVKIREAILQHAEMGNNISDLRKAALVYRHYCLMVSKPEEKFMILEKATKLWSIILNHPAHNNDANDINEAGWIQNQFNLVRETLPVKQQEIVLEIHTKPHSPALPETTDHKTDVDIEKLQPSYSTNLWRQVVQFCYSCLNYFFPSLCPFDNFSYGPIQTNQ